MRKFNFAGGVAIFVLMMTVWFSATVAQDATPQPTTPQETEDASATDEAMMTPEAMPQGDMTFVRFAHFSQDAGDVDIYVDGELSDVSGAAFKDVSEWMALPGGSHDVAVVPAGQDMSSAVINADAVDLASGNWYTIAVVGSADKDTLAPIVVQENIEPLDQVLPGTATYTFLNALGSDMSINFVRDDVPYVTALGSGADQAAFSTITDDAGEHVFSATNTENDEVVASADATDFVETNAYLIALVGGDNPEVLVLETRRASMEMVQGNLEEPGTIVEVANSRDDLQAFADLIDQAGLTETLSGEGPYTVFVPADFALDDIPAGTDLKTLLLNHVVEGDLKSMQVADAGTLTTMGGQQLTVTVDGNNVLVNGNQVIVVNIPATNGTIHIINGVLNSEQ